MNKFIVKPNKSVKEIIGAKKLQEVLKPSDDSGDRFRWELNPVDIHTSQFNSDIKKAHEIIKQISWNTAIANLK